MRLNHLALMASIDALVKTVEEKVKDFSKRTHWKQEDVDFFTVTNGLIHGKNVILWMHITREEIPPVVRELKTLKIGNQIEEEGITDIDDVIKIIGNNPLSENEEVVVLFRIFPAEDGPRVQGVAGYLNSKNPSPLRDFYMELDNDFDNFFQAFVKNLKEALKELKIKFEQQMRVDLGEIKSEQRTQIDLEETDLPGGINLPPPNRRRKRGM